MRTIKASLRINKNGRLFCAAHDTYKISKPPRNGCTICWTLYNNLVKQDTVDYLTEILDKNGH